MKKKIKRLVKKVEAKPEQDSMSSYDTTREETSTPQKIREGNEPEAIRLRAGNPK